MTSVLKQLDDKSNDVQSVAVKCLGTLLRKIQQTQVSEICVRLCTLILEGQSDLRDIYSIGLKTLISDVPEAMGDLVVDRLTARLTFGIKGSQDDVFRQHDRPVKALRPLDESRPREHSGGSNRLPCEQQSCHS
jgi:hypothetical protein